MVDRDALAVDYARENAAMNGISKNAFFYGSLGYDNVKDSDFDLIVSNIPAKVGEQVLTHIIKDAKYHLVKNGRVVIVVIDAINDYIYKELTTDETVTILYHKSWPGHHVYHYTFTEEAFSQKQTTLATAFEKGEYTRQKNTFSFQGKHITIDTTYHLGEYDKLSYDSQLLLLHLAEIKEELHNVLVFNPSQGYIPLAVVKQFNPQKLFLVDRDLQAITISEKNLITNGYAKEKITVFHIVGIDMQQVNLDAIIGVLPKKQELAVYDLYIEQAFILLNSGGYIMLSSTSTVITRFIKLATKKSRFKVIERVKDKGRSVIVLQKS